VIRSVTVFGTRPEAIKMMPLVKHLAHDVRYQNTTCVTGQHEEMLEQVMTLFDFSADINLRIMQESNSLVDIYSKAMSKLVSVFEDLQPDIIFVHGDTASAFSAAMAAYLTKTKVAHVEAGLRTHDLFSPWPEEGNRKLISSLAELHFSPTNIAMKNLLSEGVKRHQIYTTGNTVIDALHYISKKVSNNREFKKKFHSDYPQIDFAKKIILVTGHRRENFGKGFDDICHALEKIANCEKNIQIIYPVHMNPNVKEVVLKKLGNIENILLLEPMSYDKFVYLLSNCHLVVTDSGGIQEEAPGLGKPVVLMRDTTERPEALSAGTVRLTGTDPAQIVSTVGLLLNSDAEYELMSKAVNPFGDGTASKKIANSCYEYLTR